jgi:predicted O-methyltransferase YrrM
MMVKRDNPALTTQIKSGLNFCLNTAGLQISTTKADRNELERLEKLVERGHWDRAPFSEGFRLDAERHLALLKEICAPWRSELNALPLSDVADGNFFRNNGWFESVDADVLYCVVRHFAPSQVIEIGSGHSSRLTARAIRDGQLQTKLICVDPHPRVEIHECADEFIQAPVQQLSRCELPNRLNTGDVLFIDSSHIVMTGGDVVYLYLQVLPRLRPGVLIHVHDIFLPFEYPQEFVVRKRWGWTEQYIVHALLMGNSSFEILWPSCYMWEEHREQVNGILPVKKAFPPPSSLWLRKTG